MFEKVLYNEIQFYSFMNENVWRYTLKDNLIGIPCHLNFSNYVDLNPELVSFHILDEVHDKSHISQDKPWMVFWNYTVSYTELFENLPAFMTNYAIGKYSVYSNKTSFLIK